MGELSIKVPRLMICLHYRKETTITKLRDMMGTDIKGTNLIGLSNVAAELGFEN